MTMNRSTHYFSTDYTTVFQYSYPQESNKATDSEKPSEPAAFV